MKKTYCQYVEDLKLLNLHVFDCLVYSTLSHKKNPLGKKDFTGPLPEPNLRATRAP